MEPKVLFLEHLDFVDRTCASVCRRNGVFGDEAQDFASDVRLRLLEDDYAVIQQFKGLASFRTYLDTVIANQFSDSRTKKWGKWRPSANARRLGETAVLLERLRYRDGHSFEEACNIIEQVNSHGPSRAELRRLADLLRPRDRRPRPDGTRGLDDVPAPERADGPVIDRERDEAVGAAKRVLERALAALPDDDRLIIQLYYFEGFTVAEIARQRGLGPPRQKRLYERFKRILARLRKALEAEGIRRDFLDDPT